MSDLVVRSEIRNKYTSTGRHSGYQVNLQHKGLDEYKHLSAIDLNALNGKIHNQLVSWDAKWDKECQRKQWQSKGQSAKERTVKAHEKLKAIESILEHTLNIDDAIAWDTLKHTDEFSSSPEMHEFIKFDESNGYPKNIKRSSRLPEPKQEDYYRKISLIEKIFGQSEKILAKQKGDYEKAVSDCKKNNTRIDKRNKERAQSLVIAQNLWEEEKAKFEAEQQEHNNEVDRLQSLYNEKNPDAIVEYCEMVLNNSEYPSSFPREFDLQYNKANGMLLIDYQLPSIKDIPKINNVRYIKSRDEIEEKYLSQVAHNKLYDSAIYQIALRTLHEICEADTIGAIESVTLNGIVTDLNPSTGHAESNCIISIQANKEEFDKINLQGIVSAASYKECFKSLRGVGSSKLSTMTAIKPLLELDKSDKRFREHYEVAASLSDEINIASMPWEDFEHLVREIFAKEFTENGGEVRVTQASRDGGVDAIAFDPDPIRGGKIVIQAKRYTNVVGVSAVRDLYGTVMNEGATKGILVTTSDYGSDSYAFAKGKPLTLLNGSNLLHLLQKHGHKAKIDIKEAKKTLKSDAA